MNTTMVDSRGRSTEERAKLKAKVDRLNAEAQANWDNPVWRREMAQQITETILWGFEHENLLQLLTTVENAPWDGPRDREGDPRSAGLLDRTRRLHRGQHDPHGRDGDPAGHDRFPRLRVRGQAPHELRRDAGDAHRPRRAAHGRGGQPPLPAAVPGRDPVVVAVLHLGCRFGAARAERRHPGGRRRDVRAGRNRHHRPAHHDRPDHRRARHRQLRRLPARDERAAAAARRARHVPRRSRLDAAELQGRRGRAVLPGERAVRARPRRLEVRVLGRDDEQGVDRAGQLVLALHRAQRLRRRGASAGPARRIVDTSITP
jgi:hypothetical protein